MSKPTSIGNDRTSSSPCEKQEPPVEGLVVDKNGAIHFATSSESFLGETLPVRLTQANISDIFQGLLPPADYQELCISIADCHAGNFSFKYQSTRTPINSLIITGNRFPLPGKGNGWLLITQDITTCQSMIEKISILEKDYETSRQNENSALDEVTASLIETNVALRKEIRDRQNTLEKLIFSESRFRNLTETTSDFIWEINKAGNYTYASPKSVELLGLEPQEILGTPLFILRKVGSASEFIKNIEFRGQPQHGFSKMEYKHTKRDGFEVTVESSGEPIFNQRNTFVGFRGIDRDVTERRIYETQLKQAKELAESANLAKSEFLANMSHELRTPLHAILSFARYGEKRIDSASRKELFRFFSQIVTSGQRLLPLIDSLLDLAKLESGKTIYDFQHLDILAEFRSAIHEIIPLAEKKDLSFQIDPVSVATFASFDQAMIAQVIRNLLANAVKFSTSHTLITISFTVQEKSNDNYYLETTVSNYGIAIPAIELNTIFDKFAQSSKSKTGAGGTGLGLSICKQIVEDHGGTIWASHGEKGDTRFHFTLPSRRRLKS